MVAGRLMYFLNFTGCCALEKRNFSLGLTWYRFFLAGLISFVMDGMLV